MSAQTEEATLMTTKQVAGYLQMCESSVRSHPELQRLRISVSERGTRYRRSDIEAFLAKRGRAENGNKRN